VIKKYVLGCHLSVDKISSYSSNQSGSVEHISLITIMFCSNEFAFTVQVKHKINSRPTQILGFISICLYFTTDHFHTCMYFANNVAYFPFNCWLSFQRLCRLLWGCHFHFVNSNQASNNSEIPVFSWHVLCVLFRHFSRTPTCDRQTDADRWL